MSFSLPLRVGDAHARVISPWKTPQDRPLLVAVSGGIGSGKTTFARSLQPFADAYADAHILAREVVMPGTPGLQALVEHYGTEILDANGALDRQLLAALIFADPAKRAEVESLIHPLVEERAREILGTTPTGKMALYDIPLIRNSKEAASYDVVIMVAAPLEERLSRLVARGLSREDALQRMNAQIDDDKRRELATVWVDNLGSLADLEALAGVVATTWLLRTGCDLTQERWVHEYTLTHNPQGFPRAQHPR